MDLKKDVKEIIKWAQESDENKKKAIYMAEAMAKFLKEDKKDFTEKELENIVGSGPSMCMASCMGC
jgi:hypothetical protein